MKLSCDGSDRGCRSVELRDEWPGCGWGELLDELHDRCCEGRMSDTFLVGVG